jgi:hypothetical protein
MTNLEALKQCRDTLDDNRPEDHPPLDIQVLIEEAIRLIESASHD